MPLLSEPHVLSSFLNYTHYHMPKHDADNNLHVLVNTMIQRSIFRSLSLSLLEPPDDPKGLLLHHSNARSSATYVVTLQRILERFTSPTGQSSSLGPDEDFAKFIISAKQEIENSRDTFSKIFADSIDE